MIITRLQDTNLIYKSQLLPFIPEMNKWNLKLKPQYHLYEDLKKVKFLDTTPKKYVHDLLRKTIQL